MFDPQIFSKKSVEITVWQNGETDDSGISVVLYLFDDDVKTKQVVEAIQECNSK